jgi:hypothetical protein
MYSAPIGYYWQNPYSILLRYKKLPPLTILPALQSITFLELIKQLMKHHHHGFCESYWGCYHTGGFFNCPESLL